MQTTADDEFVLYGRLGSPYVRRTAILLDLLSLPFTVEPIAAITEQDRLRALNPLGRVPALQTPDGLLVDSLAIALTLLETHDPDGRLLARSGPDRAEALQQISLANGVVEKLVASYYEKTRRPAELVSQDWIALCEAQGKSGLDALEQRISPLGKDIGYLDIVLATGLTFAANLADPVFDPAHHPRLATLRDACEARPEFAARVAG